MENRKVFLNKHTNLLELEEHMYPLVDVDTPNVFRNLFHYDEIPKIASFYMYTRIYVCYTYSCTSCSDICILV